MPFYIVRMKFFLCFGFLISSLTHPHAQVFIEQTDARLKGKPSSYMVYGSEGLSNRVLYNKIKGSPFWNDEYKLAALFSGNTLVALRHIKLNLASNEVYFFKNDEELVLENVDVTKLIFYKGKDTSEVLTSFIRRVPDLFVWNKKTDDFVQVMNQGKYQLLKYTKRKVASADSLFGTQKRYFFNDEIYYFVRFNDKIEKMKKLNEEYFLSLLPTASNHKMWKKENNISFKKEEDVIRFLNYYNSQASSATTK